MADSCLATSQNVCSTDRERFIPCNPQHQRCDGSAALLLLFGSRNPSAVIVPPIAIFLTPFSSYSSSNRSSYCLTVCTQYAE